MENARYLNRGAGTAGHTNRPNSARSEILRTSPAWSPVVLSTTLSIKIGIFP